MNNLIKKFGSHVILQAAISILLGLFLVIWPKTTTIALVYILAGYLAVIGIISLFTYFKHKKETTFVESDLIAGIFELIIALIIFIFPEAVASVFLIILGIMVVLSGVLSITRAFEIKRYGDGRWILVLILNVIVTACGIIIIINPFSSAITFVFITGIFLIAKGAIDLLTYFIMLGATKKVRKEIKKEEKSKND